MAIRDLLLKISGDGDDAKREISDVAKRVAEFGNQEAAAKIGAVTKDAETAIERAKRELRDYGRISAEASLDVNIAKGEEQLARIKARLDNLSQQEATPKVNALTSKALLDLSRVQTRVDKLQASRAEVKVDVDRGPVSILDALTGAVGGLMSAFGSGGGGGLAGASARVSAGFISFGVATGPLLAVMAALAATIGVALVGALSALVASLAAAIAAVGALSVALAAALGPVLGVVIAAIARFAKVIQALRAQSQAAQQAQQQAVAGSSAVTAAADQQEAAARALTDANTRLGQATTQAYREMADAAEAASDAVRGVAQAEQSRDQAALNTRKAVSNLTELRKELGATGNTFDGLFKKFTDVNVDTSGLKAALTGARSSGGGEVSGADSLKLEQAILDVRQARLSEKDAIDAVSDAERNRTRTQQVANQFARDGIAASQAYQGALRGVADAQRQVNAAADEQALAAAQAKAQVLTDDLTTSEQNLLAVLQKVGEAFRTALGPATDAVLGGLGKALESLANVVKALQPAFTAIGVAIAGILTLFAGELVKPEWLAGIALLASSGAQLASIFGAEILQPFLELLFNIAVAAMPFLIAGMRAFGDLLQGLANQADIGTLSVIFAVLVDNLESWLRLIGAIAVLMVSFFAQAQSPGRRLVDLMTKGALALAEWIKANPKEIKKFFDETIPVAISFVQAIISMIPAFLAFGVAAAPVVKALLDGFTFLLTHLREVGIVVVAVAALFAPAFLAAGLAVVAVVKIVKAFPQIIETLKAAVSTVGAAFSTAFEFARNAVRTSIDAIGDAFGAFVKTATTIGEKIGNGIVDGLESALGALEGVGASVLNVMVDLLNKGIGLINKATPGPIKVLGETVFPGIPDIPPIPKLAAGGVTTGTTFAQIGEAGREAVLPLTKRVFGELASAITAQMRIAAPGTAGPRLGLAGGPGGGGGVTIEHQEVVISAPAGTTPDERTAAVKFAREMARRR